MTTTPAEPDTSAVEPSFRLGYVPGATPAKWARVWRERLPTERLELVQVEAHDVARALADGAVDAALGRLPVDKDVLHAIALYEEVPVVVASRDHAIAALEEHETVALADLADEVVQHPLDDVLWDEASRPGQQPFERAVSTKDAVAVVAAGVGVLVVPKSLARLHSRKDVVHRELADGPTAPVGLVWPRESDHPLVEEMVGIVRGRTANSSRGRREAGPVEEQSSAKKKSPGGSSDAAASGRGGGAASRASAKRGSGAGARSGARSAAAKRAAQGKRARRQGR
ncbi:LysR substrate-binding domain-containing protein [Paraoerskovia marina]|uniref:LysR substrate-binding domain-containing protein n=1 Tax=Paraoerskovia marina TaxID=545619 RepID=UPI0004926D5A|nr:LysR substrate-binding domain-containing protein [Paraoerskovia marina]